MAPGATTKKKNKEKTLVKYIALPATLPSGLKKGPDRSSAPKTLLFGENIVKIGPADPEIICLR